MGHGVAQAEIQAWKHSLLEMAKVLQDEEIPAEAAWPSSTSCHRVPSASIS